MCSVIYKIAAFMICVFLRIPLTLFDDNADIKFDFYVLLSLFVIVKMFKRR